jgi:HEAT repeat protein
MSADSPRPTAARRNALATLLLLALLPAPAAAQLVFFPDQPAASPRVEKVRQALRQFGPEPEQQKKAQEELNRCIKDLRGLSDLAQALVLPDWGLGERVPNLPAPAGRDGIARDFEKALGEALDKGDRTRRCAAVTLFADMTSSQPRGPQPPQLDPLVAAVLARLLEKVAALARSDDAEVREAVARALGRTALEPSKAVAPLEKLLGDEKRAVKWAAAEALARQARGGDLRPGELGLRERSIDTNLAVYAAVVPVAVKGLDDADDKVSRPSAEAIKQSAAGVRGAVRGMEQNFGPGRIPAPRPFPGKPPPEDVEPVAVPRLLFPEAVGALAKVATATRPLLNSKDAERRVQGCQVLEAIAAARAQMLRTAKGVPAKTFGGEGDPLLAGLRETVKDLAACADHENVEVRLAALYVLEELGPQAAPAVEAAAKAMAHDDSFVRWAAARVLGKMAPEKADKAVPALAARANDDNGDVRITALAALQRYKADARRAVKEVSEALKRDDEQTRLWAVRVLAAVGPEGRAETTIPLIGALKMKEPAVRRIAVTALAKFDKPDKDTAAALRAALRAALADDDGEVRRTASEALLGGVMP